MKLRNNKGFTEVDIAIAIVILVIFVTFITSLFYNFNTGTKALERESIATYIAIQTIEALKVTDYDLIQTDMPLTNLGKTVNVENGYTVSIISQKYNEIAGNEDLKDLIKNVTVLVTYKVNSIEEKIEINTSIVNENKV